MSSLFVAGCASGRVGEHRLDRQTSTLALPKPTPERQRCTRLGETLAQIAYSRLSPKLLQDPTFMTMEAEWFDECATPPHASVLLATRAYLKGRQEHARGLAYEALGMLEETKAKLPWARALVARLGKVLKLPKSRLAKQFRSACLSGASTVCKDAAWELFSSGGTPEDLLKLEQYAQKESVEIRNYAVFAALNRERFEFAAKLVPQGSGLACYVAAVANLRHRKVLNPQNCDELCNQGSWSACAALGVVKGGEMAARGCKAGFGAACWRTGVELKSGGKLNEAIAFFDRACLLGWSEGCVESAEYLADHHANEQAQATLEQGCRSGGAAACRRLYQLETQGKLTGATAVLLLACNLAAVPDACAAIADQNLTSADSDTARLAESACSNESGWGCTVLASISEPQTRCSLLERACTLAWPQGCRQLGLTCSTGTAKTSALLKACQLGDGVACRLAAQILQDEQSRELLERACALGDDEACKTDGLKAQTYWLGCKADAQHACLRVAQTAYQQNQFGQAFEFAGSACKNSIPEACLLELKAAEAAGAPQTAAPDLAHCCEQGFESCCEEAAWLAIERGDLPRAEELLEPSCKAGKTSACACLGRAKYERGQTTEALALLKPVCDQAQNSQRSRSTTHCAEFVPYSCVLVGIATVNQAPEQAAKLLAAWCQDSDHFDALACRGYGTAMMQIGNTTEAARALCLAAQTINEAQIECAKALLASGNPSAAFETFSRLCMKDGVIEACIEAANLNPRLELFERGCELGLGEHCFKAAQIYKAKGDKEAARAYTELGCSLAPNLCPAVNFRR